METESDTGQLENMHGCCASNNHAGRLENDGSLLLKGSSEIDTNISRAKVQFAGVQVLRVCVREAQ